VDNTRTRFESKLSNYDRMMSIGIVLDGGSIPPASTKVYLLSILCWGCSGLDRARKKDGRFGKAKVDRIGTTRSKKQINIKANDDFYTEEYALAA